MKIDYVNRQHLTVHSLKSFIPTGGGVLFTGVGERTYLPEALGEYRVLCNDLYHPETELAWLVDDVRELDYEFLVKLYPNLVSQTLCDRVPQHDLVLDCVKGGLWANFDQIIIEFCDNPEHYIGGSEGMKSMALNIGDLIKGQGFNPIICANGDHYMLFASKSEAPEAGVLFPIFSEPGNGFLSEPVGKYPWDLRQFFFGD